MKQSIIIVPRGTMIKIKETYALIVNNYLILFPLFAVFFSFLSILWTTNWQLGLFRSLKISELVLLYFYIIHLVTRGTNRKNNNTVILENKLFHVEQLQEEGQSKKLNITHPHCSTWNNAQNNIVPRGTILKTLLQIVISIATMHSILATLQIVLQHSIGLFWLKESFISQITPGVAKLLIDNNAYIRAYGLFPHPNIFGGYLTFSIILSMLYLKLFHVEHGNIDNNSVKQKNPYCSTWNNMRKIFSTIVPRGTILLNFLIALQLLGLLLTFSKSAIIGLMTGLFYIKYQSNTTIVPRGTITNKIKKILKLFHVEQFRKKIILSLLILLTTILLIRPNINSFFLQSLEERNIYLTISYDIIKHDPFIGIGAGQFVNKILETSNILPLWQYQPVHDVYLLIASEYGTPFLLLFIFFMFSLFKKANCSTRNNTKEKAILTHLRGILIAFLFIMLFDHYFWDIQQGQLLLWILFGLIAAKK
jgi:hypothetical protein